MQHGVPIPTGHYATLDSRLNFGFIDTRFPFTLFIPQEKTEELLEEYAISLGVDVRRDYNVTQVLAVDGGAEVRGTSPSGDFALAARYLVGTDGARSIVRDAAEIEFPGYEGDSTFILGDVVLGAPLPAPVISMVNPNGCMMIAPLGDGKHHRIVLLDPDNRGVSKTSELTLDELATSAAKIAGADFAPSAPIWLSRFNNETRLATAYRSGPYFLAGDAAHIHMPAGGQGMNVGIQDAMNLGWKLAAVIKGEAPTELLDSYQAERRPVGQQLHDNTLAQTSLMTAFDPAGQALRKTMNRIVAMPEVNQQLALELSAFGVRYPTPLLGGEAGDSDEPIVGGRIGDCALRNEDGSETTLYALLGNGRWLHLQLSGDATAPLPDWLPRESVTFAKATQGDKDSTALAGIAAIVIRPDGHVASAIAG